MIFMQIDNSKPEAEYIIDPQHISGYVQGVIPFGLCTIQEASNFSNALGFLFPP